MSGDSLATLVWEVEMAKKRTGTTKTARKLRAWTEEEERMLKTKATVIAGKLKRSYVATRKKASTLGVSLGGGPGRKRA